MNIKENKGVTLIVLTITIIILLIIAGITIYTGSKLINQAKTEDVKTNMLLIEAEVKNFVEQAKFENKDINAFTEGYVVNGVTLKLEADENIGGEQYYKIVSPMSELNLGKLENEKENYLVSIKINEVSVTVYFKPGVADNSGQLEHLLTQMP